MDFLYNLPTCKNGKTNPHKSRRLEMITVVYLPKPAGIMHGLHVYFNKSALTIDRASHAKRVLESQGRIYIGLIEQGLITDLTDTYAIDAFDRDELKKCGASGFSFRGMEDLISNIRRQLHEKLPSTREGLQQCP